MRDLIRRYDNLLVDRRGDSLQAYMVTSDVTLEIDPSKNYMVMSDKIIETSEPVTEVNSSSTIPTHVELSGEWISDDSREVSDSNILGGTGVYISDLDKLNIPIADTTRENLNYYNAKLLYEGEVFTFETSKNLPMTLMEIGEDYVDKYMMKENGANGIYIEYHNVPHFHMPAEHSAGGYLVLGKEGKDKVINLSAFSIPYSAAVYTSPFVIHNDCFLIGKYHCVYSDSEEYSTVRLINSGKEILEVIIS